MRQRHPLLALLSGILLCACLQAHAVTLRITLEAADNSPYSSLNAEGEWAGAHIDIARAVAQRLGWETLFMAYPWSRAQNMLVQGTADAILYLSWSRQRQSFAYFLPDNRLHVQKFDMYIRREDKDRVLCAPPLASMLDTWRFGAPRDYYLGETFDEALRDGRSMDQRAQTPEHLFRMLLGRRIDIAIAETGALRLTGTKVRDPNSKITVLCKAIIPDLPVYIGFRKQGNGIRLAEQFAAAYAAFRQSEEYAQIIKRHGVLEKLPEDFRAWVAE